MSDQGRYRKIFVGLFRDPRFIGLCDAAKNLVFYILAGPQSNRIGLFVFSVASASEELRMVPGTLKKHFANVCETFGWQFDPTVRVLFIPSWFKWNPPENPNVLKGSLKDLNEIPRCELVDAFWRNLDTLPVTLHETFIQETRKRLWKGMPNQEPDQDQETRTQEQECALTREDEVVPVLAVLADRDDRRRSKVAYGRRDHARDGADDDPASPSDHAALVKPVVPLSSGKQHGRLFLHRWQLDALIAILGPHATTFGLDEWIDSLTTGAAASATLPPNTWKWVQSELHAEIARRALPVVEEPSAGPTNKRIAGLIKGTEAFLRMTGGPGQQATGATGLLGTKR